MGGDLKKQRAGLPKENPEKVRMHDFVIPELGRARTRRAIAPGSP